jgi:transposase
MTRRRYELTDQEWSIISPLLPNKPRGVPRVDDRRVLNGILWRFRTGSPWAEIPERYGPPTTCYNRFVRWRKAGVWDRLLAAVSEAYDGDIVMIDSTCVRVHQHAATGKRGAQTMAAWDVPAAGSPARSTPSSMRKAAQSLCG